MVFISIFLKFFRFFIFLLIISSCTSKDEKASDSLYQKVTFLNQKNDSLSIKDIIKFYKKGDFNIKMKNQVVYTLKNQEATWLHFTLDSIPNELNFSIWSVYLDYSKVYLVTKGKISELNTISLYSNKSYNSKYRFPSWKFNPTKFKTNVFVKVKDNKRATSLKFLLQDNQEFLNFVRNDFFKLGVLVVFLLIMLVIIISIFIAKRQFSLLWYGVYIIIFIVELIVTNGIDLQFNFINSPIINNIKKMLLQTVGAFFVGLFFINFYTYTKNTLFAKKIFKYVTLFYFISTIILVSFILFNKVYIPKIYLWLPGRVLMVIVLFVHIYLIRKKILPFYLGIAFTMPIFAYFIFVFNSSKQDWTYTSYFLLENLLQISFIIEMIFIFYYIISQLVKSEFLAINLKNENLALRNSFQNTILETQEKERNKLLNNVHDSFGGYLEALKLRLLNKSQNTPEKIQEILDSFYKEYRYLLNNLYSPKINSENFIENLVEFCERLNEVASNNIKHNFSLKSSQLPPEKCLQLYRIISELTTNAIKYSKASEVKIRLKEFDKNLELTVIDNGIGFDLNKFEHNKFGLKSVKERVNSLKGNIKFNSKPNYGTNVLIKIPLANEK